MNIWQVRIWVWLPPVVVHQSCEDITPLVIFTEKVGRFLQQPESSCARVHAQTHTLSTENNHKGSQKRSLPRHTHLALKADGQKKNVRSRGGAMKEEKLNQE